MIRIATAVTVILLCLAAPAVAASPAPGSLLESVLAAAASGQASYLALEGVGGEVDASANCLALGDLIRLASGEELKGLHGMNKLGMIIHGLPADFEGETARLGLLSSSWITVSLTGSAQLRLSSFSRLQAVGSGDAVRWLALAGQGADHADSQPAGQDYDVGLYIQAYKAQSGTLVMCAPLAQSDTHGQAVVGMGLSVLRGASLYQASISGVGSIAPGGQGKLVASFDKVEWNAQDDRGAALGGAVDIGAAIALTDNVRAGICLRNAVGVIVWPDALAVKGKVNTDTLVMDENGYLIYVPSMTGTQRRGDWRQSLPRTLETGIDVDLPASSVHIRLGLDGRQALPSVEVKLNLCELYHDDRLPLAGLGYSLTESRVGVWSVRVDDRRGRWSASVGKDMLTPSAAGAITVAASARLSF